MGGTIRVSFNQDATNSAANSFRLRSRPRMMSIECRELALVWVVAGNNDIVDDEDRPLLVHGGAAVREDLHALLIVPVMEDGLHDVGITTLRAESKKFPISSL